MHNYQTLTGQDGNVAGYLYALENRVALAVVGIDGEHPTFECWIDAASYARDLLAGYAEVYIPPVMAPRSNRVAS